AGPPMPAERARAREGVIGHVRDEEEGGHREGGDHARPMGAHALAANEEIPRGEERRARRVETRVEQRERPDRGRRPGLPTVNEQQVPDQGDDRHGDRTDQPPGGALAHGEARKNAAAAAAMTAVAPQPRTFNQTPFVCSPMILALLLTSMTSRSSGGARIPLRTAEKKSMRIGFIWNASSSMPPTIAPTKTR